MSKLYAAILFAGMLVLSGCNGSSGENETITPNPTVSSVTLTIVNSDGVEQQSFAATDTITLVANVYDESGIGISGKSVSFSADIGELNQSSKLTDSTGQARVIITNAELFIGAGTATASSGDATGEKDYEFLAADPIVQPSISAQMRLGNELTSQFKGDEQVQISVTLLDSNNQPISGDIINFVADKGLLATDTALTNGSGVATVTLSGNDDIGAGVAIATHSTNTSITPARINYEITPADAVIIEDEVRIGYLDSDNVFHEGEIFPLAASTPEISAGGTLGLIVDLVDASGTPISAPTPVSFTSNCVQSSQASIDDGVLSIKGRVNSTYEDISCAGINGTQDSIVASVTVNGVTSLASTTVDITGEQLGSIEFISAEPTSIVLKGTGGQGKQETSTLTFQVKSDLGNPLSQQAVDFVLDTQVGGIELTPTAGLTNSQGFITTKVKAGSVPTAVRVTAKSTMSFNGEDINVQTQSDLLSINTGLPEQSSMTISTNLLNPEAFNINGVEAIITAQLADNFNNPVPDGTTVNFTTEGGAIEGSCTTTNGACSVTWTSAEPKPESDHRITILATASGHETFFESNGNNVFDEEDGSALTFAEVNSGLGRVSPQASGFIDMSEAWRDDNENNQYDAGEKFIDFNNDGEFSAQDGLFNGPQCDGSALCAPEGSNEIHVRKALRMVMASSTACYSLTNTTTNTVYNNNCDSQDDITIPAIADGDNIRFNLSVSDTALQTMPQGTTISVSASAGLLDGVTSLTVGNTLTTSQNLPFVIVNSIGGDAEVGTLTVEITSPAGVVTAFTTGLTLN